ncbi:MAG: polysaccharide pyruvyl transferase family protein [Rhodospirillales bacterium]|nr:polysaccharide pyruvyl transferase family protein [Rhodospirillales bacterium]
MKLYYWRSPSGNFGDDLNQWLWDDLLPGWRTWDPARTLLGVGTILNTRLLSDHEKYLVCGSGAGFGQPPTLDGGDRWKVSFVRGQKTADLLGLPKDAAIGDPATIIPHLTRFSHPSRTRGKSGTAFVPHCHSDAERIYDWERICDGAGLSYISPRGPSHEIIKAISCCDAVMTESMHAAIIADAFRVPWKPVSLVDNFNKFKWEDWASTLDLQFEIVPLPKPAPKQGRPAKSPTPAGRAILALRKILGTVNIEIDSIPAFDLDKTEQQLIDSIRYAARGAFYLSKESLLDRVQGQLVDAFGALRREYGGL